MWVLSTAPFSAVVNAGSQPAVSSISEPVFVAEREPISQFSLEMEAESPGTSTVLRVRIVMILVCLFHVFTVFVPHRGLLQSVRFSFYVLKVLH